MNTDRHRSEKGDDGLNVITERIIGCAYRVHNALGSGFLEKVDENALAHELRKCGLGVAQQVSCNVTYDGVVVGVYVADIVVEGSVLVELKAVRAFEDVHFAQCINYLAATGLSVCLLLNFGRKVEIKRLRL